MTLSRPVGRERLLERLFPLPACALITAPPSTGKRTCAEFAARLAGVSTWDLRLFPAPVPMKVRGETVRSEVPLAVADVAALREWCREAPRSPAGRYAVVRLDHVRRPGTVAAGEPWAASEACLHALLKLLEEPPRSRSGAPSVRFALLASAPVLETIRSRSTVLSAGLLSAEHVAEVLYRTTDMDRPEAASAAVLAGGRVSRGVERRSFADASRQAVLAALHDLNAADVEALALRSKSWTDLDTDMLIAASHEVLSRQFRCFSADDLDLFSPRAAMSVLRSVRSCSHASPRMVIGRLSALVA